MTLTKNECGFWEVRIKGKDGKIKSFTTKQKTKREAKRVIREAKIAELERASEVGMLTHNVVAALTCGQRMNTDRAMSEWIKAQERRSYSRNTIETARAWITAWFRFRNLENKPLTVITEDDVDAWINREDTRAMASTRRNMLSACRSFCSFCVDKGWLMANPAAFAAVDLSKLLHSQKESTPRQAFLDQEITELLEMLDPDGDASLKSAFWYAAVAISRYTGLRMGDIAGLEWSSFSVPGKIIVWTQKRDKRVELDLVPEELRKAVSKIPRVDDQFCFPEQRLVMKNPTRRATLSAEFGNILAALCIFGKTFHCLRHTYVQECYLRGIPMPHIAANVGHSNVETTRGYLGGLDGGGVTEPPAQPEP